MYTKCKEVYDFCILKKYIDFNDLNFLDEDQQVIDFNLINSMSLVRHFFLDLQ
jgi:hypothetical protein